MSYTGKPSHSLLLQDQTLHLGDQSDGVSGPVGCGARLAVDPIRWRAGEERDPCRRCHLRQVHTGLHIVAPSHLLTLIWEVYIIAWETPWRPRLCNFKLDICSNLFGYKAWMGIYVNVSQSENILQMGQNFK